MEADSYNAVDDVARVTNKQRVMQPWEAVVVSGGSVVTAYCMPV